MGKQFADVRSVCWLAVKVIVLILLMRAGVTSFIYQNF